MDYLSPKQKELLKKPYSALKAELDKHPLLQTSGKNVAQSAAVVGQTYIMIIATSMAALIKEHMAVAFKTGNYSKKELDENLEKAFFEIVDSGEVLSGFTGSAATHAALSLPLKMIHEMILNSAARPFFKMFMINFTSSLISFTGWEFSSQLWKEATYMLDGQLKDPEEKKFLADRNNLFSNIYKALNTSKTADADVKRKAARKVLENIHQNLLAIVFTDSNLRIQWLYNTIRLRMATGQFATSIAIMTTVTSIGTTVLPGAGFFWGLVFGLTGGIISIFVPEEQKNSLSVLIKDGWSKYNDLTSGVESYRNIELGFNADGTSLKNPGLKMQDVFIERVSYREKFIDVYIERIFTNNQFISLQAEQIDKLRKDRSMSPDLQKVDDAIAEKTEMVNFRTQQSVNALMKIVSTYATESQILRMASPQLTDFLAQEEFEVQQATTSNMAAHFCTFAKSFFLVDPTGYFESKSFKTDKSAATLLSICSLPGFITFPGYKSLAINNKENYDSALRFLDRAHWTHFNELRTSLDRLAQMTLVKMK